MTTKRKELIEIISKVMDAAREENQNGTYEYNSAETLMTFGLEENLVEGFLEDMDDFTEQGYHTPTVKEIEDRFGDITQEMKVF